MLFALAGRCERVRQNNGITEVLITRRADFADPNSQEEHALLNVMSESHAIFEEGQEYWIEVRRMGPRLVDETPENDK